MDDRTLVEDTYVAPRLGIIQFLRNVRSDQLALLPPEVFDRNLIHNRFLFLDTFLVNKPEYIEHVLLTNHANYGKSRFLRRMLGPLLGNGLLISEGKFWLRQRRIAAPAFHHRSVAWFVNIMADCTETMLDRWRAKRQPFDVAGEMMALTLTIIARTLFATEVSAHVETIRPLVDTVVAVPPSLVDIFGLPEWMPRRQSKAYRQAIAAFDDLVARLIAERRGDGRHRGDLLEMLLTALD